MIAYARVTLSDEAKYRTQSFALLSIGSRVGTLVTFGENVVFCWKFEVCYFGYNPTKSCY